MAKVDQFKKIDSIMEKLSALMNECGESLERATEGVEQLAKSFNTLKETDYEFN